MTVTPNQSPESASSESRSEKSSTARRCPDCGIDAMYRSRPRNQFERALKNALPIHYYRCHRCGLRRRRMHFTAKSAGKQFLSVIGYISTIVVILAVAGGVIWLLVSFFSIRPIE